MKPAVFLCVFACGWAAAPAVQADDRVSPGRARLDRPGAKSVTAISSVAVVEAVPVNEASALKLDGDLTDEVWERAPKIEGFLQREPKEGAPPTYPTEARVAYDAANIYVAVTAHDPQPDGIVGHLTRRDTDSPSDWIRVAIDSVLRQAHGVRVLRQPGRRETGQVLLQRRQRRGSGLGRRLGRRRLQERFGVAGGVPDSAVAAPVSSERTADVRSRDRARRSAGSTRPRRGPSSRRASTASCPSSASCAAWRSRGRRSGSSWCRTRSPSSRRSRIRTTRWSTRSIPGRRSAST